MLLTPTNDSLLSLNSLRDFQHLLDELNSQQQVVQYDDRLRTLTPDDFLAFKRAIYKRYEHAPHLALIDERLMDALRFVETGGKEGHAFHIFEMPPRHGKTVTISRLFPPFVLGHRPELRFILSSYGATLAQKNSRYARNIIRSPMFRQQFGHIELAKDSKASDAWDIEGHEGGLDAMGVGGGVTGKGGNIIIIDDPVKSREEAEGEGNREKVWDWYTDDIYTRREPNSAIIIVMTRWHQDDLVGRLLKIEPDKWQVLRLPALAEADDPLGRAEGAALWADRFTVPVLRDIETTLGSYSFSALYQQNPVPAEGGIFKRAWFDSPEHPRATHAPPIVYSVRYWDLAMSEKTTADFTAGVLYGIAEDGHRYVLDVFHARVDWGDLTERLAQVMIGDGQNVAQYIENKGYMSRAIEALNIDTRLNGYQIWGVDVDKDKVTRALPAAAKASSGVVHVVDGYWTDAFLDELCSFPYGAHDDQVDAFAGAETALGSAMMEAVGGMNVNTTNAISESVF
jgi:predicted phage terminase large subunit-like protein